MKPYIPKNPKNCRVSTYLTADEMTDLAKIIGERSVADWLRGLVLAAIEEAINNLELYVKDGVEVEL